MLASIEQIISNWFDSENDIEKVIPSSDYKTFYCCYCHSHLPLKYKSPKTKRFSCTSCTKKRLLAKSQVKESLQGS